VLYGLGAWQATVANRWKGQINENAKVMTFANAFPELCHNEILGWVRAGEQGVAEWVGVVLQDGTESAKMKKRAEVTERLVREVATFHRVSAVGGSLLERMLSLVLYGDFVSLYLAALNGVDPENIDSINVLKSELATVE
jgi:glucose/mannose-6-phosphate isomerase